MYTGRITGGWRPKGLKYSSSSDFLDKFYAALPPRPSQNDLEKLHRPESCRSNRRTGSYTNLSYSDLPPSRPKTASHNSLASIDISSSRPKTAVWKSVSHSDVSNIGSVEKRPQSSRHIPSIARSFSNNDLLRPRSSLRRERSNTHLINGFYQRPSNDLNEQFYNHGPYFKNPDQSPFTSDFPRVFKSDASSFFNGKVYTIKEPSKKTMSRPSSGAQARVQFQPPKPDVAEVDHHYLDRRRRSQVDEMINLGDRINHLYIPPSVKD